MTEKTTLDSNQQPVAKRESDHEMMQDPHQYGEVVSNALLFNKLSKQLRQNQVVCPLSGPDAPKVDHKGLSVLRSYISEIARMMPRRITGVSTKKQRSLSRAIKRARHLALLPYTTKQ